jgi:hypothetical protein
MQERDSGGMLLHPPESRSPTRFSGIVAGTREHPGNRPMRL